MPSLILSLQLRSLYVAIIWQLVYTSNGQLQLSLIHETGITFQFFQTRGEVVRKINLSNYFFFFMFLQYGCVAWVLSTCVGLLLSFLR